MRLFVLFLVSTALCTAAFGAAPALPRSDLLRELETWAQDTRAWEPDESQALEKDLLLEWIYRLKFAVAVKYNGTDASFMAVLKNLREVENAPENRSLSRLAPFLDSLIEALETDREPVEPIFSFTKEFTEFGGILRPPTADEFSETREYRSPGLSEPAQSLEVDELAEPVGTELAPEPAVLDPAEGDVWIAPDEVIQSDESALQLFGDPAKPFYVL
jgi:hypothetical protein